MYLALLLSRRPGICLSRSTTEIILRIGLLMLITLPSEFDGGLCWVQMNLISFFFSNISPLSAALRPSISVIKPFCAFYCLESGGPELVLVHGQAGVHTNPKKLLSGLT